MATKSFSDYSVRRVVETAFFDILRQNGNYLRFMVHGEWFTVNGEFSEGMLGTPVEKSYLCTVITKRKEAI